MCEREREREIREREREREIRERERERERDSRERDSRERGSDQILVLRKEITRVGQKRTMPIPGACVG